MALQRSYVRFNRRNVPAFMNRCVILRIKSLTAKETRSCHTSVANLNCYFPKPIPLHCSTIPLHCSTETPNVLDKSVQLSSTPFHSSPLHSLSTTPWIASARARMKPS